MKISKRSLAVIVSVVTSLLALVGSASAQDGPIPWGGSTDLPDYTGAPAKAHPTSNSRVPQNPFLAPNPFGFGHNDSWNSDVVDIAAPLGLDLAKMRVFSSTMASARRADDSPMFQCTAITFDSHGRLISGCIGPGEASLVLADPQTLAVLAYEWLPVASDHLAALGSVYFYLDNEDQIVASYGKNMLVVFAVEESSGTFAFVQKQWYDLKSAVPEGDNLGGVMADFQGRIWFATAGAGAGPAQVCVLNKATYSDTAPQIGCVSLGTGELMRNTFATMKDSAYVVSSKQMYGIAAGADDRPYIMWKEGYKTTGTVKPGQYSLGSGTSPTIVGNGKYVAITDNDDQLHVVVYRTAARLGPLEERLVCEVPVFAKGAGADENSLIGMGLSLIAENSYNYANDFRGTMTPSKPGFARVDINPNGKGCSNNNQPVWENDEVASTVSARLSTRTGLIYTVARVMDKNNLDAYYWTAMDWRTGEVVWQKMAGTGFGYDSWYPGVLFGPDGAMYSGTYGGLIAIRESR